MECVCNQVDGMLVVDLLVDVLLLADVVLNFHTGYIEEQVPRLEQVTVS